MGDNMRKLRNIRRLWTKGLYQVEEKIERELPIFTRRCFASMIFFPVWRSKGWWKLLKLCTSRRTWRWLTKDQIIWITLRNSIYRLDTPATSSDVDNYAWPRCSGQVDRIVEIDGRSSRELPWKYDAYLKQNAQATTVEWTIWADWEANC